MKCWHLRAKWHRSSFAFAAFTWIDGYWICRKCGASSLRRLWGWSKGR